MINGHLFQTGKKPAIYDPRTLLYRTFRTEAIPAPPPTLDYSGGVPSWGMKLNGPNHFKHGVPGSGIGDCVPAAAGNGEQVWTLNAGGVMINVPNGAVLKKYEAWGGYVPGQPNTDNGCVIMQALKGWTKVGFNGRPPLYAYTAIHEIGTNNKMSLDLGMLREAMWLFGGANIGLQLPLAWQNAMIWDVGPESDPNYQPGSWGGHNVWFVGYNSIGPVALTWSQPQQMTWAAVLEYCDEGYALLSRDWISNKGLSPSNYNFPALDSALQVVKQ